MTRRLGTDVKPSVAHVYREKMASKSTVYLKTLEGEQEGGQRWQPPSAYSVHTEIHIDAAQTFLPLFPVHFTQKESSHPP